MKTRRVGSLCAVTRFVTGATIVLLWSMALWHSWECRGLFWDGAYFLLEIVRAEGFLDFGPDPGRRYAMAVVEIPVVVAIWLDVSDLHWLARWWSLGMFGVPTTLYTLAVLRARNEPVLLAATIAAVAMVFMTTSFFIVGEYNTAHAAAILAAVWLATTSRLVVKPGIVLVLIAVLALRSYETFVFLGPLLALMTCWTIWRASSRPALAAGLHAGAAVLFLGAATLQACNLIYADDEPYLAYVLAHRWDFQWNRQLALVVTAASVVLAWGLVRPDDLRRQRPYVWAGLLLVLIALSPLLFFLKVVVGPPYAWPQHAARIAGGGVTAVVIILMWSYAAGLGRRLPVLAVLNAPEAARRFVAFAGLMLLAMAPWDIFLTRLYAHYLQEVRTTIRAHSGVIVLEGSPLDEHPNLSQGEQWTLPSLSLILRSRPNDGIIQPPIDSRSWGEQPFLPSNPPDLGRFVWRD